MYHRFLFLGGSQHKKMIPVRADYNGREFTPKHPVYEAVNELDNTQMSTHTPYTKTVYKAVRIKLPLKQYCEYVFCVDEVYAQMYVKEKVEEIESDLLKPYNWRLK